MKLLTYPNPILRLPCKRVAIFDEKLRQVAQQMVKVMLANDGIGLAAPQVGLPRRLIICWDGSKDTRLLVMCNPVITSLEGEDISSEGCLSFPGQFMDVSRATKVTGTYQDLRGKWQKFDFQGVLARCAQHEIEHLDGVLFIDHKIEA